MQIIKESKFWDDIMKYVLIVLYSCSWFDRISLCRMQIHLEPLARAQNVMQATDTRMDHVLLILGQLYFNYKHPNIEGVVHEKIHLSLEMRWQKCDQEVFIMAVVLNPYI